MSCIIAGAMILASGTTGEAARWRRPISVALAAVLCAAPVAAQSSTPERGQPASPTEPPQYEETVDVVGVTPIHGVGIERDKVPANVQTATSADMDRLPGRHVGDLLAHGFGSVSVNEAQSNAFQPDIQFRGFAASPLLGLPQGIAVYQDGVRVNELFGDTVNWDVLPVQAIASVNLMPGSNPLFGLNALGGAISLQTKNGFSSRGHSAQLYAGSFGRRWLDIESGGHGSRFGYFITGRLLAENGWRDFSESTVRQLFASLVWRGTATTVNAAVTGGANRLVGNGPAPVQLLDQDRRAVFTHPDSTRSDIGLFSLTIDRVVSRQLTIDAVLFYRPVRVRTVNGDDTPYGPCEDAVGVLCGDEGDGSQVLDERGRAIALADDPLDATNNTSSTRTDGWGGSLQATWAKPVRGRANQLIVGGSLDAGRSRYGADTELARLTDSREAAGAGVFDGGAAVRLRTNVRHGGLFASDYLTLTPRTTFMGSARLTHSQIRLRDQIGTALDGDHTFTRLNPAGGVTFAVTPATTVYGSVSLTSRAPTPSELSCADPEAPCRLPNAFVADPPLQQVVARTFEAGVRGRAGRAVWNASAFTTANHDDVLFVSSGAMTNQGHFENVGDTRRLGIELGASGSARTARWSAAYTWLRATFRTPLVLSSPHHPDAVDGEVTVTPGASLPGVPRHTLKLGVHGAAGAVSFGSTLLAFSGQHLRGDEPNRLAPIEGFATVGASVGYAIRRNMTLVLQISNLLNAKYATFGLLGDPEDVLGDDFDNPRFVSPGAPRAAWVGLEYSWR